MRDTLEFVTPFEEGVYTFVLLHRELGAFTQTIRCVFKNKGANDNENDGAGTLLALLPQVQALVKEKNDDLIGLDEYDDELLLIAVFKGDLDERYVLLEATRTLSQQSFPFTPPAD